MVTLFVAAGADAAAMVGSVCDLSNHMRILDDASMRGSRKWSGQLRYIEYTESLTFQEYLMCLHEKLLPFDVVACTFHDMY